MPSTLRCRVHAWYPALLLGVVVGCGDVERNVPAKQGRSTAEPKDSLALTTANREVWFTLARKGQHRDGTTCIERGLEIRSGAARIPVPLLYTRETPVLLNDSTMRAVLWTSCTPGEAYRVDLRSGRPLREPAGTKR